MVDWMTAAAAVGAGTVAMLLALLAWRLLQGPADRLACFVHRGRGQRTGPADPICFLFRGRTLVDATGPARSLLAGLPGDDDWTRLAVWLGQHFPDPQGAFDQARGWGQAVVEGSQGLGAARLRLTVEEPGTGLLRITIADPSAENASILFDSLSLAAMEEELAVLRDAVDHAPVMIWREAADGAVSWANAAYLHEVERANGGEILWPMPRLIELPREDQAALRRAELRGEEQSRWFDCHVQPSGSHRTIFAVPADDAVRAQQSLREFVQTLTKTFADLPIGLAIFDRSRRLQLFNPALIDLTGLATSFLTARPSVFAFLDALRESRMVPEPRDYRSWREQMATLEAAATNGRHVETWSLPGGQTYRVTGRPHPDGAIALLIEDITAEVATTRRFRAELSLSTEILNAVEIAMAIFDADGRLLSANRAYDALWRPGATSEAPMSLRGHLQLWRSAATDGPGHEALRQSLVQGLQGAAATGAMVSPSGGLMAWSVRPLSAGRRAVTFQTGANAPPHPATGAADVLPPPLEPAAPRIAAVAG